MVKRNPNLSKLQGSYLFPEIFKRKQAFLNQHPEAKLISLSIGDTTEPLPPHVTQGLNRIAVELGTLAGYRGYGPEQGDRLLREKISEVIYRGRISADEIFISDGAKCDIARLQFLFGKDVSIAVQDPAYPVYVDTSVMTGQTGEYHAEKQQYKGIVYLPCTPENNFFPLLNERTESDLIYFCSPNNPTGAVATYEQLSQLVDYARKNRSIIIFDAAYANFIQDSNLPKSIYEISRAKEVAIEIGSFSKLIGFTGVRLGWSVVPKALTFEEGHPVHADWHRLMTTCFNGASIIAQKGGFAALEKEGLHEVHELVKFYMENTRLIRECLQRLDYQVYGGIHAPYLWVKTKEHSSWEAFEKLLHRAHILTTPGAGFGPSGEGFLRFSAFGHRESILEAIERLQTILN